MSKTNGIPKRVPADGPPRVQILIVCEGEETEPRYLEALCRHRGLAADEVEIYGNPSGSHPGSLVEYAIRHVKRRMQRENLETSPYDRVWCVFDRDDHENLPEAIARAEAEGFKVALSDPCFEMWFVLHFEFTSAQMDCRDAISRLRKHLPDYDKSTDLYDVLLPLQAEALRNSVRLRRYHTRAQDPPMTNPATAVDRLVRELNGV